MSNFQDFIGGFQTGMNATMALRKVIEDRQDEQYAEEQGEAARGQLDQIYGEIERLEQEPQVLASEGMKLPPEQQAEAAAAAIRVQQANTLAITRLSYKAQRIVAKTVTSAPSNKYLQQWGQAAFQEATAPLEAAMRRWDLLSKIRTDERQGRREEAEIEKLGAETEAIKAEPLFKQEGLALDKRRVALAEEGLDLDKQKLALQAEDQAGAAELRGAQIESIRTDTEGARKKINQILPPEALAELRTRVEQGVDVRLADVDDDQIAALAEQSGLDPADPDVRNQLREQLVEKETLGAVKQIGELSQLTADVLKRKDEGEGDEFAPLRALQKELAKGFQREGSKILTGRKLKQSLGVSEEQAGELADGKKTVATEAYKGVQRYTTKGKTNPEGKEAEPYKRGSFEEKLSKLILVPGESLSSDDFLDRFGALMKALEDPDALSEEQARALVSYIRSEKTKPPSAARAAFGRLQQQVRSAEGAEAAE